MKIFIEAVKLWDEVLDHTLLLVLQVWKDGGLVIANELGVNIKTSLVRSLKRLVIWWPFSMIWEPGDVPLSWWDLSFAYGEEGLAGAMEDFADIMIGTGKPVAASIWNTTTHWGDYSGGHAVQSLRARFGITGRYYYEASDLTETVERTAEIRGCIYPLKRRASKTNQDSRA